MLWVTAAGRRAVATSLGVAMSMGVWLSGCSSSGSELPSTVDQIQRGWKVTTFYSAVEHLHDGPIKKVTGCIERGCATGQEYIGYYPSDFVDAVEFLGSGLLEHGPHDGRYLTWVRGEGFWVDLVPRDAAGGVLVPFESAAAGPEVLPLGTSFELSDCGRQEDGSAVPQALCDGLSAPQWTVVDEIPPGFGTERQIDLYVGNETPEAARGEDPYVTMLGADVTVSTVAAGQGGPAGATSTTELPFGATTTTGLPFGVTTTTRPTPGA
jgi:hypothetical protein